jgi:hypothetical protein
MKGEKTMSGAVVNVVTIKRAARWVLSISMRSMACPVTDAFVKRPMGVRCIREAMITNLPTDVRPFRTVVTAQKSGHLRGGRLVR